VKCKIAISVSALVVLLTAAYGFWIEPYQIDVKHLYPDHPSLKRVLSGKTAVHVSDLHLAAFDAQTAKLLEIINESKPDLVFLTGDYVPWNGDYEPALEFLAKIEAIIGVWAVMGDYDYSNDRKSCLFCHEAGTGQPTKRHRVRILKNAAEEVSIDGETLRIIGLENESEDQKGYASRRWTDREGSGPSIVLSHSPLMFDELAGGEGVLVLAGDTHGGQVWLPKWLWSLMGYEKNARYDRGWFEKGSNRMHVSRGLGTSHVRFRLMCRPEVVVVHF
jgi:predicted MPP superfamily phosphohydrolase